ncbi:hypothetical protein D3C72_1503650 [compost metagenome]
MLAPAGCRAQAPASRTCWRRVRPAGTAGRSAGNVAPWPASCESRSRNGIARKYRLLPVVARSAPLARRRGRLGSSGARRRTRSGRRSSARRASGRRIEPALPAQCWPAVQQGRRRPVALTQDGGGRASCQHLLVNARLFSADRGDQPPRLTGKRAEHSIAQGSLYFCWLHTRIGGREVSAYLISVVRLQTSGSMAGATSCGWRSAVGRTISFRGMESGLLSALLRGCAPLPVSGMACLCAGACLVRKPSRPTPGRRSGR